MKRSLSHMEKEFYNYLVAYPSDRILPRIKEIYRDLKGECMTHPNLGENGCKEMAGLLMLWEYVYQEKILRGNHKYDDLFAETMINFGMACFCIPAGIWSGLLDKMIENSPISLGDWTESYFFFDENFNSQLNSYSERDIKNDPILAKAFSQISDRNEQIAFIENNILEFDFEFSASANVNSDIVFYTFKQDCGDFSTKIEYFHYFEKKGLNFTPYLEMIK